VTYLHPDHLGTPKFGTNAGGTQVWAWAPDAFGNGSPSGAATVNLRMPGQFYDAESSLFYNWNRYYNPAISRYISSDPIGLQGGLNTFNYAFVNPVMNIDPKGLETPWPPGYGDVYYGGTSSPDFSQSMDKGQACLAACASEFFGDSSIINTAQGASLLAATPVPKSLVGGAGALGSGNITTLGSAAALLTKNAPRMSTPIMGTTNVCRALARGNQWVAGGILIYDAAALTSCTPACAEGQ